MLWRCRWILYTSPRHASGVGFVRAFIRLQLIQQSTMLQWHLPATQCWAATGSSRVIQTYTSWRGGRRMHRSEEAQDRFSTSWQCKCSCSGGAFYWNWLVKSYLQELRLESSLLWRISLLLSEQRALPRLCTVKSAHCSTIILQWSSNSLHFSKSHRVGVLWDKRYIISTSTYARQWCHHVISCATKWVVWQCLHWRSNCWVWNVRVYIPAQCNIYSFTSSYCAFML